MTELTEMTETAGDAVLEAVESQEVGPEQPRWHKHVALTTLIMALLAALGGLLAGITASEALLERTKEIIEVSYLEGDRVSVETLKAKHEILTTLGETPHPAEVETLVAFEEQMRELEADTAREEALVLTAASTHMIFAIAVTLLSLGITLGGMAVVLERKLLWVVGLVFGAAGAIGVGLGVLTMLLYQVICAVTLASMPGRWRVTTVFLNDSPRIRETRWPGRTLRIYILLPMKEGRSNDEEKGQTPETADRREHDRDPIACRDTSCWL